MLPPHQGGIIGVVDRVGPEAPEDGLVELGPGRPDGQHHRRGLLAGGQGHDLIHLLVDAPGLIHDGQGEVQALQPLRHGREDLEA